MATQQDKSKKDNKNDLAKPDEETLNKTDPQDNMEGPISSMVQGIKEEAEENDEQSKKEADNKQDKNK